MQYPGRGDYHVGLIPRSGFGLKLPAATDVLATDDFLIALKVLVNAVFLHRAFEILLNFTARREIATPVRIGFKGVGVGVGRDITGQARVGIFPPGAADL